MNKVKLILFDLGGVLVELDKISVMWAEHQNNYSMDECWAQWLLDEDVQAIDRGKMEVEEFLKRWKAKQNIELPMEDLAQLYRDLVRGDLPGGIDLVKECKAVGHQVACLSNMTAFHWPHVEACGFKGLFDYSFVSCLIGHCKPEERAYEIVLEAVPYKAEEIVFFDDNIVNLQIALDQGFQGHVVKGVQETREKLIELKLLF